MGKLYAHTTATDYFEARVGDEPFVPHVLLHPTQLPLIEDLFGKYPEVNVCSVNHFHPEMFDNPEEVTRNMPDVGPGSYNGGWRQLNEEEYIALRMADPRKGVIQRYDYRIHPALKAGLAFATGACVTIPLLRFIMDVFDIRRFAVTGKPLCTSKIKSYYKLISPDSLHALQVGARITNERATRVLTPVSAWRACQYSAANLPALGQMPGAFLFRHYYAHLERLMDTNPVNANAIALLLTTRRFIDFAFLLWRSGVGDLEFKPERFFENADEVDAYKHYMKNFDYFIGHA